jgi:hypothetical protein
MLKVREDSSFWTWNLENYLGFGQKCVEVAKALLLPYYTSHYSELPLQKGWPIL